MRVSGSTPASDRVLSGRDSRAGLYLFSRTSVLRALEALVPLVFAGFAAGTLIVVLTAATAAGSHNRGPLDRQAVGGLLDASRQSDSTFSTLSEPDIDPFQRGRRFVTEGTRASLPSEAGTNNLEGFVLHGVRSEGTKAGERSTGTAIISFQGGPQQLFELGDRVGAGVTLAEVAPDHVILRQSEARVRLDFAGGAAGLSDRTSAAAGARVSAPNAADRPWDTDLGSFIYKPAQLSRRLTLAPLRRGEEWLGFEVGAEGQSEASRSALREAGLRPGDVLITANGLWITQDTQEAFKASLELGRTVEVVLDRGSQRLRLRLEAEGAQ